MENMRNMLHGVVVYVLFFTVQSYEERIFTSETPISDGKNDSNARTGISKEPKYGPRTASIMRNSQTISGDIIMKENTSMTIPLRCASSCNPPCKIAWYINGQLDPRDNPVINIKLDRKVSGVYQCEASGEEGKVEADPVNVTIQYPPGNVKITPGNDTFYTKRGMKPLFDIICEADCLPECTYTWYTEEFSSYETGNNLFARKSLKNRGSYRFQCRASNDIRPYSHINSRWITVEVKDGPDNVTIKPSSSSEKENSSFQLTCHASCIYGCQSYSWYYNDNPMTQSTHILNFQSLYKEDSGKYQCRVTDYFGATNSEYYTVNVQYGPKDVTIKYSSWYKSLIEGQDYITLTCNADCNPECSYLFYQNGTSLNERYIAKMVFRNMSGRYTCSAKNRIVDTYMDSSDFQDISIRYPPGNVTITPGNDTFYIKRYGKPDIICEADCVPECTYRWYREGYRYSYTTGNNLFATRSLNYSGSYKFRCLALNTIRRYSYIYSRWITVEVKDGPDNVTIIPLSSEIENSLFQLLCSASCHNGCQSYSWYYNGRWRDQEPRILKFQSLSKEDSGNYRCRVTDDFGTTYSEYYKVNVQYPPGSVTISPSNYTIYTKRYGKPLHDIICEADCLPECTYRWYIEKYPYIYQYASGNNLFATESSDILLMRSNRFFCRAFNNIGSRGYNDSRRITVETKDGPDNVEIITSFPARENGTITLTCVASCYHGCQSYSWYHNSASVNQSAPILTFHNISKGDSGEYQCKVTDYFGEKYGYYTVYVQYGPKSVTIQYSTYYPSLDKYLIEGKDYINITCKADCFPECTYFFYQNGKLLNNTYIYKRVHRNMSGRYTCVAKNSILNTYKNSSNFEDINIKYKPNISSDVDQRTITAPGLLDLTFIVDSFPSSNVTIFHETKPLTLIPNVNGQLSFNVSIESCLDREKYRVEAVNDAGSDSFTFIADVKCSPVIVGYSNLSQKGYQVGDSLSYRVDFMANPEAGVSWTFIDWNKKELKELKTPQLQNLVESTVVEINRLNFSNFGKYKLELKNDLGYITQEFDIRGPPQRPTDLNVDCPGSAIISWKPGFDGGAGQDFIIEYSDNSSNWQSHRSQPIVPVDNTFMSAQINDIQPNTRYSFRIRAENSFGFAESDTAVNCTRQNIDEMASFTDNPNALVGIGVLVLLLLIATAALIVVIKLKQKRESKNQDNSLGKQDNNSNKEDNASEIVENVLYITADDAKEQIQAREATTENPQSGSDVYAVVEKKPKPDDSDDQPVYTDVCKADQKKKKPATAAKPSKVKKDERPTVNKEGLIYVDLDLKDTPSTSTGAFVIHGADDRTQYVDIDFTRRADPPPDMDNKQSQNEKEKEKA